MIENILNSLPYIFLLSIFMILSIIEFTTNCWRKELLIRYISLCSFVFFFGFRGFIGWDVHSYYFIYSSCPLLCNLSFHDFINSDVREPGFYLYMSFLKSIWNNYHFYVLFSTCVDIVVLNYFFKRYTSNYAFCFLIFMTMLISFEIDLQRNVKALMLFFISIKYIEKREFLPFLFLNLLGASFHITSLLYIPLYFFIHIILSRQLLIFIFVVSQTIYFAQIEFVKPFIYMIGSFMNNLLGDLLITYITSDQFAISKGVSIGHLERMSTFLMILVYYDHICMRKKSNIIFINSFIIYACIQIFFVEVSTLCNRLALLFVFSYFVIWPELYYCFHNKINKLLVVSVIFIYSVLKVSDYNSGIFFRYDNILFEADSFEKRHAVFDNNYSKIINN